MTDELYNELKGRLLEEGLLIKKKTPLKGELKRKQMSFLTEAYEHFKTRRDELHKLLISLYGFDWTNYNSCLVGYGWDNIRHLVCWTYGVCVIADLPDDKQKEINELAIDIIDMLFDRYSKVLKES